MFSLLQAPPLAKETYSAIVITGPNSWLSRESWVLRAAVYTVYTFHAAIVALPFSPPPNMRRKLLLAAVIRCG